MLEVVPHPDASAFLARAEPRLVEDEAINNIILSVAHTLTGDSHFKPPFYLATVEDDGEIVGFAQRTPPDGLYVTTMPSAAVPIIASQLGPMYETLTEVTGPENVATEFAKRWRQPWHLHMRNQHYCLTGKIAPPAQSAPGSLRKGQDRDLPLLREWAPAYAADFGTLVDVAVFFEIMVRRGVLYLWDDDGARCVVTASGRTPNGARISAVFTPQEHRGKGYATSAVAATTREVLDSGKTYINISANAEDAIPNHIYSKLGFERRKQVVIIYFD